MTITLPDDFNFSEFDAQIETWVNESLPLEELERRAKERWPFLHNAHIHQAMVLARRRQILRQPSPINLDRELRRVHVKRLKRMKQVETILDAGDAPVGMHTLYRGLLRDHEAMCFKIIANQRQDRLDRQQTAKLAMAMDRHESKSSTSDLCKILEKTRRPTPPAAEPKPNTLANTAASWLIAVFLLSTILVGHAMRASQSPATVRYEPNTPLFDITPSPVINCQYEQHEYQPADSHENLAASPVETRRLRYRQ